MKPLADAEIPPVIALGRQVAEEAARKGEPPPLPPNPRRAEWIAAMREAEQKKKAEAQKA